MLNGFVLRIRAIIGLLFVLCTTNLVVSSQQCNQMLSSLNQKVLLRQQQQPSSLLLLSTTCAFVAIKKKHGKNGNGKNHFVYQSTTAFNPYQCTSAAYSASFPSIKNSSNLATKSRLFMAKPKKGSIVDSYRTVSVNCSKCKTQLFRYKKKNGTKSNLIKCYKERITQDCTGLLSLEESDTAIVEWKCPNCQIIFGRDSMIHGRPAIKLIGGKTRMTNK